MEAGVAPISTQISNLARAEPDALAVTCDGRTLTRSQLDADTNRLARAYAEMGVGTGDYVSIAMPNSIEWLAAVIACWKLGAVPQPLSPRLPDAEFAGNPRPQASRADSRSRRSRWRSPQRGSGFRA